MNTKKCFTTDIFIIYTPSFNSSEGGVTVLHKLCHHLNELGHSAYLWPMGFDFSAFKTNPQYNTPLADPAISRNQLKHAIVIYPEIVTDNPLNAPNVVRWLLHKPGFFTGKIKFGKHDFILGYSPFGYKDISLQIHYELVITENHFNIFYNYNNPIRTGSCFTKRKNTNAVLIHDLCDSEEIINSAPTQDLAKLFNKTKYFYSYDPYTFLCTQAALCGCIPIVIPQKNLTKDEWRKSLESGSQYYGVAYGFDDIAFAEETVSLLRPYLEQREKDTLLKIQSFVEITKNFFYERNYCFVHTYNPFSYANYWYREIYRYKEMNFIKIRYLIKKKLPLGYYYLSLIYQKIKKLCNVNIK